MLLKDYVESYQKNRRMSIEKARVRVCQDQLMSKLMKSKYKESFTFKGGTVMYELSKNERRSTMDVDVDVIGISISKEKLIEVFAEIGVISTGDGIAFHIMEESVKELKHQAYRGKRLTLVFQDTSGDTLSLVLDIGVHNCLGINQNKLMIIVEPTKEKLRVLVNPPEQIVAEKTVDIVKKGIISDRMKDIFDIYFILNEGLINKDKLVKTFKLIIEKKNLEPDNVEDYLERFVSVLITKDIKDKLKRSDNWLDQEIDVIVDYISAFFSSLLKA